MRLTEDSRAIGVLKEHTISLEAQLHDKTKDYQTAMEANRRLQYEMKQVSKLQKCRLPTGN